MPVTPDESPVTATGISDVVPLVPFPSWPAESSPQHMAAPAVVRAHAWLMPEETAVTPDESPETGTGWELFTCEAFPSWPAALSPQHSTAPATTAHVWFPPAEMPVAPEEIPFTGTGSRRFVVEPSPSWPYVFWPQHSTVPPLITAQVWNCP